MKTGHYLVLSDEAFEFINTRELLRPEEMSLVTKEGLAVAFAPIREWAAIIADVDQVDDDLARELNRFQRQNSLAVGILPFAAEYADKFSLLMRPAQGRPIADVRVAAYSADSEHASEIQSLANATPQIRYVEPVPGTLPRFSSGEFDLFAGVTNGRQTFCMFGDSFCLHPGLNNPPESVLTPDKLDIRHWFVQSCHSPFVWPDFGDYLSFPLAVLLRGKAISCLVSTRVQAFIPHVLASFVQLALSSMPLGEIVLALNQYCSELECDDEPFLLFGHPQTRVVEPASSSRTVSVRDCVGKEGTPENLREVRALQHLCSNLRFALFKPHFELNQKTRELKRLHNVFNELANSFAGSSRRLRSEACGLLPTSAGTSVKVQEKFGGIAIQELLRTLNTVWKQHKGYYYHFSQGIEDHFEPVDATFVGAHCPSCGSKVMRKRLRYLGPTPARDYSERVQRICPRCLVILDVNAREEAAFHLTVSKTEPTSSELCLAYCNRTEFPQWFAMSRRVNDPNNVSVNVAPRVVSTLKQGIRLNQQPCDVAEAEFALHWIQPQDVIETTLKLQCDRDDLFYILLEFDLFVDGAWNWLSYTYRRPVIEKWLGSDMYLQTLPK